MNKDNSILAILQNIIELCVSVIIIMMQITAEASIILAETR